MNQRLGDGKFLRITEIYAFIAKDENGHEGIMGFQAPDKTWMPMIGADVERVEQLTPFAEHIAKVSGHRYEIRYFKTN